MCAQRMPARPAPTIAMRGLEPAARAQWARRRGCLGLATGAEPAPEGQGADEAGEGDREERLVRAAAFNSRRGALRLPLHCAFAELPGAPAEDGIAAVDDAHLG